MDQLVLTTESENLQMTLKQFIKEVGVSKWVLRTALRQFHKRILKKDHYMRLPTGERFLLPCHSKFASEAFVTGGNVDWGSEKLLFAFGKLNPGQMLDIGANIGYYSLYMRPACDIIYSFEPDPRMRLVLQGNVSQCSNIIVRAEAVGHRAGSAAFVLEADGEVSHLWDKSLGTTDSMIEVDITTIDHFAASRQLRQIKIIKTDIEGADIDAISGGTDVLKTMRPIILTEANPTQELFDIILPLNYQVFAYARERNSRNISFLQVPVGGIAEHDLKMLFLLPEELVHDFRLIESRL